MDYYHDLITEKSWEALQKIKRHYDFVLIGGWAVYLYTHGLKSRDIDFMCDYKTLEKLRQDYEVIKNDRLKKYEIHWGEFDIDIYTPFFSNLPIPTEDLMTMTMSQEGFAILKKEALLILKQKAHEDRKMSAKGEKDKIDILAILKSGLDIKAYQKLLKKYHLPMPQEELTTLLKETREVPELDLNAHQFARLKREVMKNFH